MRDDTSQLWHRFAVDAAGVPDTYPPPPPPPRFASSLLETPDGAPGRALDSFAAAGVDSAAAPVDVHTQRPSLPRRAAAGSAPAAARRGATPPPSSWKEAGVTGASKKTGYGSQTRDPETRGSTMALRFISLALAFALVATVTFASGDSDDDSAAAAEKQYVTDPSTGKQVVAPEYGGTLVSVMNKRPETHGDSWVSHAHGLISGLVTDKLGQAGLGYRP